MMRCALLLVLGVLAGCGGGGDRPPLGRVSGTVTLDGQPAGGLIILFSPEDGRPAAATTASDGTYTLEYVYGVKGTKVGRNRVSFEWPLGAAGAPIAPEFGTKSEIYRDITSGSNKFDFDVKSSPPGKAVAPVE